MPSTYEVLTNDQARAWLFPASVFKCSAPAEYFACLSVDGLARDFGEVTRIECPDETQYGQFIEVGTFGAETSRLTTSLTGRFSRTNISDLYKLAQTGCAFDLQIHMGMCQRPTARNEYDKVLVFEKVNITSWSTDPLVALTSGDRAVVNETIDISVGNFYEIVNIVYTIRGETETDDGPIVSIEFYDIRNCGGCDKSDGCQKVFAVSEDGVGYFSTDGGTFWTATPFLDALGNTLTTLSPGDTVVDAMAYEGLYIALTASGVFWYIDISDWIEGVTTTWTQVTSGLPGAGTSLTSYGNFGVVVGAGGIVSKFVNQDVGTTIVEDGTAANGNDLNDVHTCGEVSVAVGDDTIIYSYNGVKWQAARLPAAGLNYTAVLVRSKSNWLVGTDNGQLWCNDSGTRYSTGATVANNGWSRIAYPGWLTPTGPISDLQLSSDHVVWMTQGDRLLRSIDGGATWVVEPNSRSNIIDTGPLNSIATCVYDVNKVIAAGEAVDGTGIFMSGSDPAESIPV